MDIHYSEINLGDINQSNKNNHDEQNIPDDNMNPYAAQKDGIHDTIVDDKPDETNINLVIEERPETSGPTDNVSRINIMKTMYLKSYQEQLKKQKLINNRRNDIMRSVANGKYHKSTVSKPSVKQLVQTKVNNSTYSKSSFNRLINLRKTTVGQDFKKHIIPTNQSYTNQIRLNPEVNTSIKPPMPIITKSVQNCQIRREPNIPKVNIGPWYNSTVQQDDFLSYAPNYGDDNDYPIRNQNNKNVGAEQPKDVSLAEIVGCVLQDVLSGKITSIENAIGKLRINYEEKNVFENINKRNIILLNFEDDSMRPVLKIEDKYMDIIKKWYEDCDLLIDIEETSVSVPENITTQDVSGILFQDINYKYKDEYLNNYMPLIINNIISKRSIKDLERKYFVKPINELRKGVSVKYIDIGPPALSSNCEKKEIILSQDFIKLNDIGITIPDNINSHLNKDDTNKTSFIDDHCLGYVSLWNNGVARKLDPELLNKRMFENPYLAKDSELLTVLSYNDVFQFEPLAKDIGNKLIPVSYTSEYNHLYPRFSENCDNVEDVLVEEEKKLEFESICVLINDKFLQTLTIKNPDQNILHIIKNHSEFGFVKLFDYPTKNSDIINFIEREFNKVSFNDIEEVNKKLLVTSQYIDFSNKQKNSNMKATNEEQLVKKYFNSKYLINDNINNKMKASTLYDIIINSNAITIEENKLAGFRTRLSKYLKDLGLQKKRYNDGFYYYGIIEKKPDDIINNDKSKSDLGTLYSKKIEERLQDTQNIVYKRFEENINKSF